MTESDEYFSYLTNFPTELLLKIFSYLPGTKKSEVRGVCIRWKVIIDELLCTDKQWHNLCKREYFVASAIAQDKRHLGLLWCDVYRSLSLWPKLASAQETRDEFASASNSMEEVQDFTILRRGTIGVHTNSKIVYYDTDTLKPSKRPPLEGEYLRYTELEDMIIVMGYQLHLYVMRKYVHLSNQIHCATYVKVRRFLIERRQLYYVNLSNEIYFVHLNDPDLNATLLTKIPDAVLSIGFNNKHLNILSINRNIYTVIDKKLVTVFTVGPDTNLLDAFWKYHLLEQLDWRIYFQWMYILNHSIPHGPLLDIITVRTYGDIIFIGSNWGVLRIYHAPYCNGEFDLFNSEPLKQFNFMERYDCPVLSMCPILQVDVSEAENGHTVFVAMPKKIAVLKFVHKFRETESVDFCSIVELRKKEILRMNEVMEKKTKEWTEKQKLNQ